MPITNENSFISDMTVNYVAGCLSKNILSKIINCSTCKSELSKTNVTNLLIKARQYKSIKHGLCNPSTIFFKVVKSILTFCSYYINDIFYKPNIAKQLALIMELNIDFPFSCHEHDIKNVIINKTITLFLNTFCKNINRILKGVDTCQHSNDPIKNMAIEYYKKHSKRYKSKTFLISK